jgi:beta-galactosidase
MREPTRRAVIGASAGVAAFSLAWSGSGSAAGPVVDAIRLGREQPFDHDWRFRRGAGEGLERATLDDSSWRTVDLPHDWSIEDAPGGTAGPFDAKSVGASASGYTVGGEGWYRRHFTMPDLPAEAHVEIVFDGAYLDSDVWLNGQHLGRHIGGYTAFAYDLTPHLNRNGANVVAVRVRNLGRNSRWYTGSGLYRSVTLNVLRGATRVARLGVAASTRRLAGRRAEIAIRTELVASAGADRLVTRLIDPSGRIVAEADDAATTTVDQTLVVPAARLWSPDSPTLYTLESELRRGATVMDTVQQPFGIRVVEFDAKLGMALNGTSITLRGGCLHHDNGLLGACAFRDADERRIRLMKARGYNAVRSSHNAASRTLRAACDRLGMFLIEEAFDAWVQTKEPQDFAVHFEEHWREVIEACVLGARNSPSVIMWSIGNEIPERNSPVGVEWQWRLANAVRTLDPTRPVTAGLNGVLGAPLKADAASARPGHAGEVDNESTVFLDVLGYNYRLADIEREHAGHADRVVYGSETFASQAWDYTALAARAPYFLGEFVWTAMDYLGEAGIGMAEPRKPGPPTFGGAPYPWVNAYCGDIDLIGNQKAASRYRDVVWGLSPLELAVQRPVPDGMTEYVALWGWSDELQSWNWPAALGKPLAVRVYSSGDRVVLLLNGRQVAARKLLPTDKMRAEIKVPYAPGVLEAVAYRGNREIGRRRLVTVSAPARLSLNLEAAHAGAELRYVGIDVRDAQGRIVPDDRRSVTLSIDGPARLIGFGSATPLAVGSYQAATAQTFHGRALAILRSSARRGMIRIEARSPGLRGAAASWSLG